MRGVYYDGNTVRLRKDLPEPGRLEGEVVLKVRIAGICDTDLQIARGYMNFRGILGHEFVGETESGQRFVAEINAVCHHCDFCRNGLSTHCPNRTVLGILGRDGAMADRVSIPTTNLHPVPPTVSDREAVFVEPLAAAFRMIEQVPIGPAQTIAILGDGKLGLLCAWVARLTGASVTLIGKHPEKLAFAGSRITTKLLTETSDRFDVVADCTGSASGLETALRLVRSCGTIILKTTVAGQHSISLAPVVIDEIRVVGSRCGPFPPAIQALGDRTIDVLPLIAAEFPLEDAEEGFSSSRRKRSTEDFAPHLTDVVG